MKTEKEARRNLAVRQYGFLTFESGLCADGWRGYWRFLRSYPAMAPKVEHDCFVALIERGLVCA